METLINRVMDWIFHHHGNGAELRIGIWDDAATPHTFYAVVTDSRTGNVVFGEDSYGADSPEEALSLLVEEIESEVKK